MPKVPNFAQIQPN